MKTARGQVLFEQNWINTERFFLYFFSFVDGRDWPVEHHEDMYISSHFEAVQFHMIINILKWSEYSLIYFQRNY